MMSLDNVPDFDELTCGAAGSRARLAAVDADTIKIDPRSRTEDRRRRSRCVTRVAGSCTPRRGATPRRRGRRERQGHRGGAQTPSQGCAGGRRGGGEIYAARSLRASTKQIEAGLRTYANPRNTAAGSLRQKDAAITASRELAFWSYQLGEVQGGPPSPAITRRCSGYASSTSR
jgi:hypothetical protein